MRNVTKLEPVSTVETSAQAPLAPPLVAATRRPDAELGRELVRRAQSGDREAFEDLIQTHEQRVFAIVNGVLRRREDVEDVVQQIFIKVFVALKRFDLRSTFSTWLYKVAVNECYDYLRKKRVRRLVYESDLSEEQVRQMESFEEGAVGSHRHAAADASQRAEMRQVVERLLDEISEQDRLMMVLKEVEGFSVEEIGEILGLNVNTVKVRLFRARGRLVEIYRTKVKEGRRRT